MMWKNMMNIEQTTENENITKMASCKIRSIRDAQVSERRRLEKYEKASTSPSSYEYLKSAARTYIYDCKMFIKSMLTLNQKICEYMSSLQRNRSRMASGKVNVTKRENVQRLHDTSVVKRFVNLRKNTHLIKQHSEEWLQLRQEVHLTKTTAYNVLGFRGGGEMRQHYDEFIHKKGRRQFDDETQQRINSQ